MAIQIKLTFDLPFLPKEKSETVFNLILFDYRTFFTLSILIGRYDYYDYDCECGCEGAHYLKFFRFINHDDFLIGFKLFNPNFTTYRLKKWGDFWARLSYGYLWDF